MDRTPKKRGAGPASGAQVAARPPERYREVRGLKALRRLVQRSQGAMAKDLGITQPSVLKIERQSDLYLSTLRRFVEAAGGTLKLRVEMPGKTLIYLTGLGEPES